MSRRGRRLSDEERVLWATVTRSIAPLRSLRDVAADDDTITGEPPPKQQTVAKRLGITIKPVAPLRPPAPPPPTSPALAVLDRRQRKRVAKGRDAIDGRIDLHGLTQAEAHDALAHFLHSAVRREARLVLVITGKGSREGGGVLRRQVPLWLALPDFRGLVIGF
ncbi:MAG: Smr/MutS family protein, partial [Pseudolabrys sp.]